MSQYNRARSASAQTGVKYDTQPLHERRAHLTPALSWPRAVFSRRSTQGTAYRAAFDFAAQMENQMALSAGEAVTVTDKPPGSDWWMCSKAAGPQSGAPPCGAGSFQPSPALHGICLSAPPPAPASALQSVATSPSSCIDHALHCPDTGFVPAAYLVEDQQGV